MNLRATATVIDIDNDPILQEPTHIPLHSLAGPSNKYDNDCGAASETANPPAKRQRRGVSVAPTG